MNTKEIFYEWDIATQVNNEDAASFNFNLESILTVQENILAIYKANTDWLSEIAIPKSNHAM